MVPRQDADQGLPDRRQDRDGPDLGPEAARRPRRLEGQPLQPHLRRVHRARASPSWSSRSRSARPKPLHISQGNLPLAGRVVRAVPADRRGLDEHARPAQAGHRAAAPAAGERGLWETGDRDRRPVAGGARRDAGRGPGRRRDRPHHGWSARATVPAADPRCRGRLPPGRARATCSWPWPASGPTVTTTSSRPSRRGPPPCWSAGPGPSRQGSRRCRGDPGGPAAAGPPRPRRGVASSVRPADRRDHRQHRQDVDQGGRRGGPGRLDSGRSRARATRTTRSACR